MGKENLRAGVFWHVSNRGVDGRDIFIDPLDSWRFLKALEYCNTTKRTKFFELFVDEHGHKERTPRSISIERRDTHGKLVIVMGYCLHANHYHLLLKELVPGGVSLFMKKLAGGYTSYFNNKHVRNGPLFCGRYKSYVIQEQEELLGLSACINLNNHLHNNGVEDTHVLRTSVDAYVNPDNGVNFLDTSEILSLFKGTREEYISYIQETVSFIFEKRVVNKNFFTKELLE